MDYFKHNRKSKKDLPRCSKCIHAHKIDDECDNVYECDAEEYDLENLTCFVPKEEKPDGKS